MSIGGSYACLPQTLAHLFVWGKCGQVMVSGAIADPAPTPAHPVRHAVQVVSLRQRKASRMTHKKIAMEHDKKIALVAHDNKKQDLVEWAKYNRDLLAHHDVYATGTTGQVLERELGFEITKLQSGPLGGD